MRVIVARCSVTYEGRLGARLPEATRLLVLKADGSIAVHSDAQAYKPLNWMSPPCSIQERDGVIVAESPKGETLRVELLEVLDDHTYDLGDDPGLEKDGVEAELQELIAGTGRGAAARASRWSGASTRPTSARSTCCAATARAARSWSRSSGSGRSPGSSS